MAGRASRVSVFLILSLLILGTVVIPIAATQPASSSLSAEPVVASQHDIISQTFMYEALPNTPGTVQLTISYEFPDSLREFSLALPSDTTQLTDTTGFSQTEPGVYEWDSYTNTPELTVEYTVNETARANQGYRFVDHKAWSIFKTTNWRANWAGTERVSLQSHQTISGQGAIGDRLVFLGPHTTKEYATTHEDIRVIVPDAASPVADLEDAASLLDRTSPTLDVGPRTDTMTIIIAPTDTIDWGLEGVQVGTSDFWIADTQPLKEPSNTWIHEYTHTRQRFNVNTTPETTWLTEATAEYYGVHLSYQYEHVTYADFTDALDRGAARRYEDVELSRQSTWAGTNADYHVGALVIAALDKTIREYTNGTHTFQDVFHDLNTHNGPIDHATFRDYVTAAGGEPAGTAVDQYVTTTTRPELWDQPTHARIFQTTTPNITYHLPSTNNTAYELTGPYRSTTTDSPPVLVPNETLTIPITITNTGTRAGTYGVSLSAASTTLFHETGRIDPGATRSFTISEQFTEPGTYFLNTTHETIPIRVTNPATPRVTNLTISPQQTAPDTPVTITATISNPTSIPAVGDVVVTVNDRPIHTQPLELAPEATTTVTTTYTPQAPGDITITANNRSITLSVTEPTPTPTQTPTEPTPTPTTPETPGFTIPIAFLALLLAYRFR